MAATAVDAYSVDRNKNRFATLSFLLGEKGETQIYLWLGPEPPPIEQIQEALGEALGCKIQDARLEKPDPNTRHRDYEERYGDEDAALSFLDAEGKNAPSTTSASQARSDEQDPEVTFWTFTGTSAEAFPKRGLHVEAMINLEPIVTLLKSSGVSSLTLMIQHPGYGDSQCTQGQEPIEGFQYGYHYYNVPVDGSPFRMIRVSFGYRGSDLIFPIGLPVSLLLLPLVLSLVLKRAFQKSAGDKRYIAWLRLWKATSWTAVAAWVGWSLILSFRSTSELLRLLSLGGSSVFLSGFNMGIYLIPPTVVTGICFALMLSVHLQMRGIKYDRRVVLQQVLVEQVGGMLIIVLFSMGIGSVFFAPGRGILLLAAAFIVSTIVGSLKKRFLNLAPYALEVGELRDRIFELAGRCGVKLKQVYILPEDKMKTINAMASSGDHIILTNALLAHLNQKEVDSVVAHELGHLKHHHPRSIGTIYVVGILLINVGAVTTSSLLHFNYGFSVSVLIFLFALSYFSRKFEYTADVHATYLMGDPRPLISALAKISRLTMLPMTSDRLSEMVSTHPYTKNRAETLARFGNVSSEELQRLVAEPDLDQARYDLASITEKKDRILSTAAKQKISNRVGLILIAAKTLIPALFALVALQAGFADTHRTTIYLIGFVTTTGVYIWLLNCVPAMGYKAMVKKLREKLERDGISTKDLEGAVVGFSPDAEIRYYENNDDWDLGYLFIAGNVLYYVGEQTRFALDADDIREIKTFSSSTSWWKSERVFISWLDPAANATRTFNLHPCQAASLTDGSRKTRALAQQLHEWKSAPSRNGIVLPSLNGLERPQIGEVTSRSLSEIASPGKLVNMVFICLFCATVVCLALQLPFNPQRGGGALYVPAVTLIVTLLEVVPLLQSGRKQSHKLARQHQPIASLEATE